MSLGVLLCAYPEQRFAWVELENVEAKDDVEETRDTHRNGVNNGW